MQEYKLEPKNTGKEPKNMQYRRPPTLIQVAGLLFADEYRGRLFELLDSYSPTNTVDAHSSCLTPIRQRIPRTLIRVAGLLFADEYRRRLFKLLNSYSPTLIRVSGS